MCLLGTYWVFISQKTAFVIVTAMKTSDLTYVGSSRTFVATLAMPTKYRSQSNIQYVGVRSPTVKFLKFESVCAYKTTGRVRGIEASYLLNFQYFLEFLEGA
jgi:hypothetical protein